MMDALSADTVRSISTFSLSSRTDNSSRSRTSFYLEKEEDLAKDNVASPVDLDCLIQTERITKLFDETIYKIKLSICLPRLVQEGTLRTLLSQQHDDDVVVIFEQYNQQPLPTSLLDLSVIEDVKAGDLSMKNRLSPEHGYLIYVLNSCPALRPVVNEMIEQMKEGYKSNKAINQPALEYLLLFERFRDLMLVQLNRTASEYYEMKINTRKLEKSNAKNIKKIEECRAALKEESAIFEETMARKAEITDNLENQLTLLNNDTSARIKKRILDSDRQMVLASRSHAVKNEILIEEEKQTRDSYENTLKSHLKIETNLRKRRFRIETQLKSWIEKYDLEMTGKDEELTDKTEKYNSELQKVEALKKQLVEQDRMFVPLMAEREKEYQQEMEMKMKKFMHEHAARVIQKAWRDVLANRAEKKKLRKLITQKQKEAEEAAMLLKRQEEAEKKKGRKKIRK